MSGQKVFIAIAGNIGTGKTTLTHLLSKRVGWKAYFESVAENPYLSDFYKDMSRWSFPMQVCFLTQRFRAHQEITSGTQSAIQDRSIYEDVNIFARNLFDQGFMEERDYSNYMQLYQILSDQLQPPDLVIYLKKSLPALKKQILLRGRDYEQSVSDQYLENLNRYYEEWIEDYSLGKKLIVPSDSLDFIESTNDFDYLVQLILDSLEQRDLFIKSR